jgi:hypothetical protein
MAYMRRMSPPQGAARPAQGTGERPPRDKKKDPGLNGGTGSFLSDS